MMNPFVGYNKYDLPNYEGYIYLYNNYGYDSAIDVDLTLQYTGDNLIDLRNFINKYPQWYLCDDTYYITDHDIELGKRECSRLGLFFNKYCIMEQILPGDVICVYINMYSVEFDKNFPIFCKLKI